MKTFVRRFIEYLDAFPGWRKVTVLAFDFHYDDAGIKHEESSAFSVPDRYAAELAHRFPDRCELDMLGASGSFRRGGGARLGGQAGRPRGEVVAVGYGNRPGVGKIRWFLRGARALESPLLNYRVKRRRCRAQKWKSSIIRYDCAAR